MSRSSRKKKLKIYLIVVCTLCGGFLTPNLTIGSSQPTLELAWQKVIETPYGHIPPTQFIVTSDGSYVITGSYLDKDFSIRVVRVFESLEDRVTNVV